MAEVDGFRSACGGFNKQDVMEYLDKMHADYAAREEQLKAEYTERENQLREGLTSANEMLVDLSKQLETAKAGQPVAAPETSEKVSEGDGLNRQELLWMLETVKADNSAQLAVSTRKNQQTLQDLAKIVSVLESALNQVKKQIMETKQAMDVENREADAKMKKRVEAIESKLGVVPSLSDPVPAKETEEPKTNLEKFVDGYFGQKT